MAKCDIKLSSVSRLLGAILSIALLGPGMVMSTSAASFPGENGKIAFTTNRDGNREIYSMNPDGSDQNNLTHSPGQDNAASWSPDGTKIAFYSDRDGNNEIYIMSYNGSGSTRLTNSSLSDTNPTWSADGKKIAFMRELSGGNTDIYTINADGTHLTDITNNPAPDRNPSWSPDGTKILFESLRPDNLLGGSGLYTMSPTGSNQQLQQGESFDDVYRASWSPDGTKIVRLIILERDAEVYTSKMDGSDPHYLTYDFNADGLGSGAWSPDGTKIVFDTPYDCNVEACDSDTEGGTEIIVTNANPGAPYLRDNISKNPNLDTDPAWQPITKATPLDIITKTLPSGMVGTPYDQTIQTTGGNGSAQTFRVVPGFGKLPLGLLLDGSSGQITGTPKRAGAYHFVIEVKDTGSSAALAYDMAITAKPPPPPPPSNKINVNITNSNGNIVNIALNVLRLLR